MNERRHLFDPFDSELCVVGAATVEGLIKEIARLIRFLDRTPDACLEDVAYTCAVESKGKSEVLAVVARSTAELQSRLRNAHTKLMEESTRIRDKGGIYYCREGLRKEGGKIAFFFPGVISFYPDILRDLCLLFDICRESFDVLTEALEDSGITETIAAPDYLYPPTSAHRPVDAPFSPSHFAESFFSVLAANTALYTLFDKMGIRPDGVIGFSGGDFSALDVAGAYGNLSREKRVQFMREGYRMLDRLMHRTDLLSCPMFSVFDAPEGFLDRLIADYPGRIVVSIFASARYQAIAIGEDLEAEVSRRFSKEGIKAYRIPAQSPFNTPWCAKVLPTIKQFLSHWIRHKPQLPVYSCATADMLPPEPKKINRLIVDQWTLPIHFDRTIEKMYRDGYRIFIEIGARGNMVSVIDEILRGQVHQSIAVNRIHRSGLTQLHHALAVLISQGVQVDLSVLHRHRRRNRLDFDKPLQVDGRREVQLTAEYPSFRKFIPSESFRRVARQLLDNGGKKTVTSVRTRKEFGADFPMLINADILLEEPGVRISLAKTLTVADYPFLQDYAIGTSQLSYAQPDMCGLTVLSLMSSLELMAEAARKLLPNCRVAQVDNLRAKRWIGFTNGAVRVSIRAERVSWSGDPGVTAVRVELREDVPNNAYTSPVVEAFILLAKGKPKMPLLEPIPLERARSVNWSMHDIYPERLFQGSSLQIIRHVSLWSEGGIDFDIEVPTREGTVREVRIPLFSVWPQLLDGVFSAFALWRSHERFAGAISLPFRCRKIIFHTLSLPEGARMRGYFRLSAVTPRSLVADIQLTDGNGNLLLEFRGCEELCERVPPEYQQFILRPAEKFITRPFPLEFLGNPAQPVEARVVTEIPMSIFEPHQELWLKALACVLLSPMERGEWLEMQGAIGRRVEWLFGRAAAKEATRRFLQRFQQARWTDADIPIWADDSGKPHSLGPWREHSHVKLDLSIAHTDKLIVAAVAANSYIGIDVESVGRTLSEEFTKGVFTHEELELAVNTGDSPVTILRFWCAKEAVSKAIGTGIRFSPKDLCITSVDLSRGRLEIELRGQWLDAFKNFRGRKNVVYTSLYKDHTIASCLLPAVLFET